MSPQFPYEEGEEVFFSPKVKEEHTQWPFDPQDAAVLDAYIAPFGPLPADADEAFRKAAVKVEGHYIQPREHHNAMEPHATVAEWKDANSRFGTRLSGSTMFVKRWCASLASRKTQCALSTRTWEARSVRV